MQDTEFETAMEKLFTKIEATKVEITKVLREDSGKQLVGLNELFLDFDTYLVEKIYGCGKFTATALPPILVLAGFFDPASRFAEFATVGLDSEKMLKHLGLPTTSLPVIAGFLNISENSTENYLCELWRHTNEKSGRKFDFFGAGAKDIVARDGKLVYPEVTACHQGCVRFDGRLVAAPSAGSRDMTKAGKELAVITRDAVAFMKADMVETRQAVEEAAKRKTSKRRALKMSPGPKTPRGRRRRRPSREEAQPRSS